MTWWRSKILLLLFCCPLFSSGQDRSYAKSWVDTLASDTFAGRGYVDNGQQLAADAIAREFYRLGLESIGKDYKQWFSLEVNSFPDTLGLKLNGKLLHPGTHYLAHPMSQPGSGTKARPGKTVQVVKREETARQLAHQSPPPVLIETTSQPLIWSVGRDVHRQVRFIVQDSVMPKKLRRVDYIINSTFSEQQQANVVGLIRGSRQPDSFLVICAHYDHLGKMGTQTMFPGAHDNASGTAMVLDLARHFSQPETRPEYSLLFIAFGAEEAGLVGSRFFAENPLVPLSNIRFVVNLDLLGGGSEGLTVVNATSHPDAYDFLVTRNASRYQLPKIVARENTQNSDHYPFTRKKVPAFFLYTLGDVTAYHNIYDTADMLPFSRYEAVFGLIADFATYLQGREY